MSIEDYFYSVDAEDYAQGPAGVADITSQIGGGSFMPGEWDWLKGFNLVDTINKGLNAWTSTTQSIANARSSIATADFNRQLLQKQQDIALTRLGGQLSLEQIRAQREGQIASQFYGGVTTGNPLVMLAVLGIGIAFLANGK